MEPTQPATPQPQMTPPTTQSTYQSTTSIPTKPSKLPIILLTIVSLISLSGLIYFYLQVQSLKKQLTSQPTPTPETKQTPQAPPSTTPNSNLQIYTDANNNLTFKYPSGWQLTKTSISEYKKTTNPGYFLYKSDPNTSCGNPTGGGGGGPCGNSASIQFQFGDTDSNTANFDQNFWGRGFPIAKTTNTTINGKAVALAYTTETRYPYASIYKIATNKQLYITSEFFPQTSEDDSSQYASNTINEINQILSTVEFPNSK